MDYHFLLSVKNNPDEIVKKWKTKKILFLLLLKFPDGPCILWVKKESKRMYFCCIFFSFSSKNFAFFFDVCFVFSLCSAQKRNNSKSKMVTQIILYETLFRGIA